MNREPSEQMIHDIVSMAWHDLRVKILYEDAEWIARKILSNARERDSVYRVSIQRLSKLVDQVQQRGRRNSGLMDWFDEQEDEEYRPARRNASTDSSVSGRVQWKDYRCGVCGNVQSFSTNHYGQILGHCDSCSWKSEGYGPGVRMFGTVHRNFYWVNDPEAPPTLKPSDDRRNARYGGDPHWMTARFDSECSKCKRPIRKHDEIFYFPTGKRVFCNYDQCGVKASREFEAARFDEGY